MNISVAGKSWKSYVKRSNRGSEEWILRRAGWYLCEVNHAEDRVEDPWNKCFVNDLALVEGPIFMSQGPHEVCLVELVKLT